MAISVIGTGVASATVSSDRTKAVRNAIEGGRAKNVILLIGDGMGDSEITIARDYTVGAGGKLNIDKFPLTGQMTTYSVLESDPSTPDYTPESASTATAWSTGHKTADGRISTSAGTDKDLTTILELAKSARLQDRQRHDVRADRCDAGAPMSHVNSRGCQGPLNMAACPQDRKSVGGKGSIAEQGVDLRVDVLLGGGKARFDQVIPAGEPNAGKTVLQTATAQGYAFVGDRAGLLAAQPGKKLLGLFTSGNMSLEWSGPTAAHPPVGPVRCTEDLRPANEPSLDDMTRRPCSSWARQVARHGARLLPPGGVGVDRQAGPRLGGLRADRRDGQLRSRRQGRARLREEARRHARDHHRRPRAHQSDHRNGRHAGRLRDHPGDRRGRPAAGQLRDGIDARPATGTPDPRSGWRRSVRRPRTSSA